MIAGRKELPAPFEPEPPGPRTMTREGWRVLWRAYRAHEAGWCLHWILASICYSERYWRRKGYPFVSLRRRLDCYKSWKQAQSDPTLPF